jgi:hypothetical protein
LILDGRREWVRAFPNWFERYLFAAVDPAIGRISRTRKNRASTTVSVREPPELAVI